MIGEDVFAVDAWTVPERELHVDLLAQTESIFALSNGHIGLRGNLDEGEPGTLPGTYLNGFYETRPLPYAEAAYGDPEAGQTMIIVYAVEPVDAPARIVVQSELVANEPTPEQTDDPRAAAALRAPLEAEHHAHHELRAGLVHRTRASKLRMAAGMDHVVDGPENTVMDAESEPDLARVTISTELDPGQCLRIVKFLAYGWSSRRSLPSVRDQVDAALAAAKRAGWDELLRSQREYLDDVWARADVELEGDAALQQAVRFALFHVIQAAARAERRAIPAKGLTGRGYDGHTFWDMDTYTLPVLIYAAPAAARDVLLWRHSTMDLAAERARELGLGGVTFPWRTIRGHECSGYWPAGTAAFHINADIADAVRRYLAATGDEEFEHGPGLDLLVATARLWRSVGHHDANGAFRIDGVTGPDEYTALVDNNVYTNLMAGRNLEAAAAVAVRHPQRAAELDIDQEEIASWRDAARAVVVPFDDDLRVTSQSEAFTGYRHWDFDDTDSDEYPLLLHFPYYLLYSSQVIKQADLVFALYSCGDCFDAEQKARDFDYYERITVRDSSLSASVQAIVAAEVGHLELAYDYFGETAFIDLRDLAFNTKDGLHLASLAGSWLVAVAGFGGMRDHDDTLSFAPRLASRITRLAFRLTYRGRRLRVEVTPGDARFELLDGEPLEVRCHGEPLRIAADAPVTCPLPPAPPPGPLPEQPPGRRPPRRHREA